MDYKTRLTELKEGVAAAAELTHKTLTTAKAIALDVLENPSNEDILRVYDMLVESERDIGTNLQIAKLAKLNEPTHWKSKGDA